MSVEVMSLAWYVGGLTPAQKAVLVALADHANEDGKHAYPSVARLVIKTSYAERTVRRALSDLRDMNLIVAVGDSTHHKPTEYFIDLSEMQARQDRPARDAPHDLPENTEDLPESADRPARDAPKPSVNHPNNRQGEPKASDAPAREANGFWTLPENLNSAKFVKAWGRWMAYVEERGLEFTETQAELTLQELSEQGEAVATESVIASIRKGWRNVYVTQADPHKPRASPNGHGKAPEPAGFAAIREFLEDMDE